MNVGDTVYKVVVNYTGLSRTLHTFTDAEGFVWHRYERPMAEPVVREITIIGKLEYVLTGELPEGAFPEEYIDSTVYYGQYISETDGSVQYTSFYEADHDLYVNRIDAEERVATHNKNFEPI